MKWLFKRPGIKQAMTEQRDGKITFDQLKERVHVELQHPAFNGFKSKCRFARAKTCVGFDSALNDLYDYCDANAIWLGL